MAKSTEHTIRQVIPGAEWSAFYLLSVEPFYELRRLICWQLEDKGNEGESEIVGIVTGSAKSPTERAPDREGFHSYIHDHNVNSGDLRPIIGEHRKKLGV